MWKVTWFILVFQYLTHRNQITMNIVLLTNAFASHYCILLGLPMCAARAVESVIHKHEVWQWVLPAILFRVKGKCVTKLTGIKYTPQWKVKGKVQPRTGHEGPEGEQIYSSTLPSASTLGGGGWSAPSRGRFTSGKDPVSIVDHRGGLEGCGKARSPTGIRSPDRPARSKSLYRLRKLSTRKKFCRLEHGFRFRPPEDQNKCECPLWASMAAICSWLESATAVGDITTV
jgi:hypothetical protein